MSTTKRGPRVGIALVLACLMGVALAAFSASGTFAQNAKHPQKKPAENRVRALVLGKAQSPVLDELKRKEGWQLSHAASARGRGNDPSKYDALVVDGDALSPEQLGNGTLVDEFADANRWVLALDASRADYQRGLKDNTGFTVGEQHGKTSMFLFGRKTLNNSPRVVMIAADDLAPLRSANLDQQWLSQTTARQTQKVASIATGAVSAGRSTLEAEYAPSGDTSPPDEAQHVSWTYKEVGSSAPPHDGYWTPGGTVCVYRCDNPTSETEWRHVPQPGTQTTNWTFSHLFDVYLDNANRPQGNFQYVTYRLLSSFSPKRAAEKFFHMDDPFVYTKGYFPDHGSELDSLQLERAWWTQQLGPVQVEPDAQTSAKLVHEQSLPATPNEVTHYSTHQEFEVGITGSKEGPEVEGHYTVSNGKDQDIPDWGVENKGQGKDLNWLFSARQPCDLRDEVHDTASCFNGTVWDNLGQSGMPKRPPDLSLTQLEADATGRWRTEGLLSGDNGKATFRVKTPVALADSVCTRLGPIGCAADAKEVRRYAVGPNPQNDFWNSYGIDVGAVNPIPIKSIAFSPNPADGAKLDKVTGTVTLERPAPFDVRVVVFSNSDNATVGPPITDKVSRGIVEIPKGQTSGTFRVLTNDNNLKPGDHTTATITAFYTTPYQEQLRVESSPKGSPKR